MTNDTENSAALAARSADGKFLPGSGGRPKGSRNRATVLAEQLLEDDIEAVVKAIISAAKEGNTNAMKLVIERIVPPQTARRVTFPMKPINSVDDIADAFAGLWDACSEGGITPEEAAMLGKLLEQHKDVLKTRDLSSRMAAIEKALGIEPGAFELED
jgi:hypothetical protein